MVGAVTAKVDRNREIVARLKAGALQTEIARELWITRQRVSEIAVRAGLRRWSSWAEDEIAVLESVVTGDPFASAAKIARHIGLTKGVIIGKLRRLGYYKGPHGWER
jgi:predicted transcriptional regulator